MGLRLKVQKHPKADYVALKLKLSTAMRRAKREPNGLLLCGDFVLWKN